MRLISFSLKSMGSSVASNMSATWLVDVSQFEQAFQTKEEIVADWLLAEPTNQELGYVEAELEQAVPVERGTGVGYCVVTVARAEKMASARLRTAGVDADLERR